MGIIQYKNRITEEGSDVEKLYTGGGTEFNKLKYKPNMGENHSGRPPLIQKRIPNENKDASFFAGTQVSRRLDDVGRIAQLFARREGLEFLANNTALNLTIPQSYQVRGADSFKEAKTNLKNSFAAASVAFPKAIADTALTLASTLASIPVAGTGTHFVKGSLGLIKYLDQEGVTLNNPNFPSKMERRAENLPSNGADPRIKQWFYDGGTKVNNSEQALTTEDFYGKPEDYQKKSLPTESTLPDPRIKQWYYDNNLHGLTSNDFREDPESYKTSKLPRKPFATVYLGDPGASGTKYDSGYAFYYKKPKKGSIDKVNEKQPYNDDGGEVSDFITFTFEILQPEPDLPSTFLQFRAFLDSFSDSYSSNWNKFNYVGRADSFYSYQAFDRNADISFKVATATRAELDPIYRKLNHLASTTAPTYSANGIMRGTVTRLTIGDYFRDTPAIINDVSLSWIDGYPWEVASAYNHLPHVLDCRVGLTILHKFTPQTLQSKFISIGSSDNVDDKATF